MREDRRFVLVFVFIAVIAAVTFFLVKALP